ncbi:hypothetical protein B0H17DRAFT_1147320 [Mycena rosella]|uniref:Uncharacterized protein n=1 Tax=Mycena rosella TaxID=1033263 RepID=A0AAD7G3H8_MYCRO|nr:hypothetical protein B0H17DRAFT_1147320 [Mycena rosella]
MADQIKQTDDYVLHCLKADATELVLLVPEQALEATNQADVMRTLLKPYGDRASEYKDWDAPFILDAHAPLPRAASARTQVQKFKKQSPWMVSTTPKHKPVHNFKDHLLPHFVAGYKKYSDSEGKALNQGQNISNRAQRQEIRISFPIQAFHFAIFLLRLRDDQEELEILVNAKLEAGVDPKRLRA